MYLKKVTAVVSGLSGILNYASMCVIFLIAAVMFIDISLRLTVKISLLGTYEITEMGMIVVIFGAMAHTQFLKGHVHVKMLVEKFPDEVQRITEGLLLLLTAVVCAFVAYSGFTQASVYYAKKATTAVLKIPYYPFAYFMAVSLALLTVMFLLDALKKFSEPSGDA